MAEITYLLGAGASYNALPIVSEMYDKIGETIQWLNQKYAQTGLVNRYNTAEQEKFKRVISDLALLQSMCDTSINFSIDTYARKLDLSGNHTQYIWLKNILSFYFTLEQKHIVPDTRYDNFWASILKSSTTGQSRLKLPDNIKVISWNYDFQLELTYQDFLGIDSLKKAREALNVSSLETDFVDLHNPSHFGIFKLNGSATFNKIQSKEANYLNDNFTKSKIDEFIIKLVETYELLCSYEKIYKNHLSFAWEHNLKNAFYNHLKESIRDTEILVVIGYSFPFFNRDIDKLILNEFMSGKLRKVYFQAPEKDVEDIRERFLAINDKIPFENLILRKDIKQFTLPNEL